MRSVLMVALLCGCFVIPNRPAVQPRLSELPTEREKQDAILDRAYSETTPEHLRSKPSALQREVETVAATVAVLVAMGLSKSANVTFGYASEIEEAPTKKQPRHVEPESNPDPTQLVPWIQLRGGNR